MKIIRKTKLNSIRAIKAAVVKKNKRKKPVKTIINETKKWQKDYDEGKSPINPSVSDFMYTIEFPEDYLYSNRRHHTKKIVIISGTEKTVEGPTITTKSRNKLGENEYLTTREDGLVEYFVPEIRKTNRTGKPIERKKQVNQLKQRKVSLSEARRIKVVLDKVQKRWPLWSSFKDLGRFNCRFIYSGGESDQESITFHF